MHIRSQSVACKLHQFSLTQNLTDNVSYGKALISVILITISAIATIKQKPPSPLLYFETE